MTRTKRPALLAPAFPGRAVESIAPLTAGLANSNYRVRLAGREAPVVLRFYTRDVAACRKDVDLDALLGPDVPRAAILDADPTGARTGRVYAVLAWIEGVSLAALLERGDSAALLAVAPALGRVLAAIGRQRFARAGFFGPGLVVDQPFGDGTGDVLGHVEDCLFARGGAARLGTAEADRLWAFMQANVGALEAVAGEAALVHGDYKGANLLLHPTGTTWDVAGVLDWEFAYAGTPLFDIGILLRYEARFPAGFAAAFARGYREAGGRLPPAWRHISRVLDVLNLCDFLSAPQASDVLIADVRALVAATLAAPPPEEETAWAS